MRKTRNKLSMLALLFVGAMAFTSCSDDNGGSDDVPSAEEFVGSTTPDLSKIQVVEQGQISWHDHFTALLKKAEEGNSEEDTQLAQYARKMLHETDSIDAANSGGNGEAKPDGDSEYGKLVYWYEVLQYPSVDKDGKEVMLSELVAYPARVKANNIVIGCHVTITSDKERPSNYKNGSLLTDVGMLVCHARTVSGPSHSDLVIIPDYQGYGLTAKDPHPYIYQNLTARQVVDGALAGKAYYEKTHQLEPDFKTISVGYSQGGSVAMAVHQFIEKANLDGADHFNFAGSVCGDGPYDPVATLKQYTADNRVYMPVASALIIKGLCDSNPNIIKGKFTPKDYFTEGFMNTGIIDWLASKKYTTDDIQKMLVEYSATHSDFTMMRKTSRGSYMPYTAENKNKYKWEDATKSEAVYCTGDQIMRPEALKYIMYGKTSSKKDAQKLATLINALDMNNLCKRWVPRHPMVVFHSTGDEVVPFANYESALKAFTNEYFKGIRYNSGTYTHIGTGTSFYAWYEDGYAKSLFNGSWKNHSRESVQDGWLW